MAEDTKIQWCDATWNPWRGCTKVSAGCAHCYADTLSKRNPLTLGVWGPNGTRVVAAEAMWREPVKWNRLAGEGKLPDGSPNPDGHRPRVFCASLADVFEDWTGTLSRTDGSPADHSGPWQLIGNPAYDPLTLYAARDRLGRLIRDTPNLDWLLVTKRPENVARMMADHMFGVNPPDYDTPAVPPNVWLGTSVENQAAADERIPHLLRTPAAVRFLSMEPLLGRVDLGDNLFPRLSQMRGLFNGACDGWSVGVDWVIVGGESGAGARPCNVEWVRDIVRQCRAAGVAAFVKQLGAKPYDSTLGEKVPGATVAHKPSEPVTAEDCRVIGACLQAMTDLGIRDKKGGTPAEWPTDLRVREFPEAAA